MSRDRIFARTKQGNDLLDNPKGRISGDELLLIALIDGHTSIEGITKKVPPSVRVHLDAIFARLLSSGIIEYAASTASDSPSWNAEQVADAGSAPAMPASPQPGDAAEAASQRCAELEQELANVRAQLEVTRAREKDVEVGFHKLRLRVSAYTEIWHAKLTKVLRELAGQVYDEKELRASFERELKDVLESLNPLNQAIAEQQQILDITLRLKIPSGQLNAEQMQKDREAEEAKMAHANPYYKKLRGLEFFKGFANAELLQFLGIAKWQEANAGDMVLNEGDVGMPFFIIVSGTVAVFKGQHLLITLEQGDFFGEFAYLSGDEPYRSARVVAETACEFLMVDPLDIEFSSVQLRLHVVEALLRGQVRRALISSKPMYRLPNELDVT